MAWVDVRAALIAVVLFPNLIYGLPIPRAITAEKLKTPLRQRELAEWTKALQGLGVDIEQEQLGAWSMRTTNGFADVHRALKKPFRPLARLTGTNQAWPLFGAATTNPTRLTIEVVRDGSVEVWFRRLDPELDWHRSVLRYRRVRGIYDVTGTRPGSGYRPFARSVAGWAFAEDPAVSEVHVFLEHTPLSYPWEPPLPPGKRLHERVIRRPE